jgi:spore germination protein (amino acid permease)
MLKEGKIGLAEGMWMIALFCCAKLILMYPRTAIELGGCAGWMISIISVLIGLLSLYIIISLLKRFPGQTIIEAGQSAAGPIIGFVAALFYLVFFVYADSMAIREFSESIKLLALPMTPLYVIIMIFIIAITICVYLGLEAMSRMALIIGGSTLFIILLALAVMIPDYNINYLFPLLGKGPQKLLLWGIIKSSNYSEILFAGLMVNVMGGWKNTLKAGRNALLLSMIISPAVIIAVIMTFGSTSADKLYFPLIETIKEITIGRFFQRVESIFLWFWLQVGFLYCSLGLYASIITFARMFKLKHYKPLIPAFVIIVFSLAILPHDIDEAFNLDSNVLRNISWVGSIVVPLIILVIAMIRGKRTQTQSLED